MGRAAKLHLIVQLQHTNLFCPGNFLRTFTTSFIFSTFLKNVTGQVYSSVGKKSLNLLCCHFWISCHVSCIEFLVFSFELGHFPLLLCEPALKVLSSDLFLGKGVMAVIRNSK